MKQQHIIPGILSIIACAWLYAAVVRYGVWDEGPRGGFMPLLAASVTLGFSVMTIIRATDKRLPWIKAALIPVGIVVAVICASRVIGLLPSLFVMLLGWFRFLEKYSWMFTVLTSACVMACVWLIFSLWLKVPFPTGWLGDWLYG